ncbi:hypothetical protein BHL80_08320 [Limosilactobacillus reuteri]|nr:hypothetical protein BHL80_08320 [Limosilactobacillus reuteri]
MIPDVTPNGVFYLPPTGWLTSFYNPPIFLGPILFILTIMVGNMNGMLRMIILLITGFTVGW